MSDAAWYEAGLAFACTRCGNCCTGEPGTVLVDEQEIAALGTLVALDDAAFRALCTRALPSGRIVLRERANGDCVFWSARAGCTVYAERPRQCRTWPFWRSVVASPAAWRAAAAGCPGMDQGPLHAAREVRATSADDGTLSSTMNLESSEDSRDRETTAT